MQGLTGRRGAVAVPVAFVAANALSYGLLLVAAHRMPSTAYGALSSLLGLLLISTIPMTALQTVAARRAAAGEPTTGLARGTGQVAAVAAGLLAAASPALSAFLHLHDVVGVLLVAACVPGTAVLGAAAGLAQGRRRFIALAVLVLAATGGRSLGGVLGLLAGGTPDATLLGAAIGVTVGAVTAGRTGLRPDQPAARPTPSDRRAAGVVAETLYAAHAHGAFFVLTSLDVLLARHVLPAHDAGVYGVGATVTRAALWLPQSVVLLLFASLAERDGHRPAARRAAAAVVVLGASAVVGCAVAGPLVVAAVGGGRYRALDGTIWLFALLGGLLAVLQLAVLAGLAQRDRRRALLLWSTVVADIVVVLTTSSGATPVRLVVSYAVVTGVAAAVALRLLLAQPAVLAGQLPGAKVASRPGPNRGATPDGTG